MTEKEVKSLLRENKLKWKDFSKWMSGQTVGLNDDGTTDYYDYDVEKFIRTKGTYSNPEEWD